MGAASNIAPEVLSDHQGSGVLLGCRVSKLVAGHVVDMV